MITRLFTISFSLLFFCLSANAQRLEKFSENRQEYLKQLEGYMTASKQKILEETFDNFNEASIVFSEEEFGQIIKTSNGMLQQKMTAKPYFKTYLECLSIVKNAETGEERFIKWHNTLDQILANIKNRKVKPFASFLEFSLDFFNNNALRYSNSGISWLPNTTTYSFDFIESEPVVTYENLDLMGIRKSDSIIIKNTAGIYFPTKTEWVGKGGLVSWERLGLDSTVFARLTDYKIDTKRSLYKVDSAFLTYPALFPSGEILGNFQDKVVPENKAIEGSYPRFESRENVLYIKDIGGGISYKGGFRLQGTTVYGFGNKDQKAEIALLNEKEEPVFKGISELFVIRKEERIAGERVNVALYFAQDSIVHPSVNFKFDIEPRILNLTRGDRGSDRNPFFNSYYKASIDTDKISWYINKDSLVMGEKNVAFGKRTSKATFESQSYFDAAEYFRIQSISTTNPIATIKGVSMMEGTNILSANNLAPMINPRFDVSNIQTLLYDLVAEGFISYDSDEQVVVVKDKLFHYADASQKKVDFDVLRVVSETDESNATFSLKNFETLITGVQNVEFSNAQKVAIKPHGRQVIMKKNRNLDFDGVIYAGFSTLQGKDFSFDYDKFHIEMDSVRYFDLFVPTGDEDEKGNKMALSIASRIEHSNGFLLIDAPSNKSGKNNVPLFPSYQSKGASFVYYDKSETQGGCYKRDSFYFQLDPFSFNSMDDFTQEDVSFDGVMVSNDIFPPYKETLVLQEEDFSLGFLSKTPPEGFDAYRGKGNYKGEMTISNKGFLGKGNLTYLGASVNSEDIIFKPVQLTCSADRFNLEEDRVSEIQVPQVRGIDVKIDWRPYKDSMYVKSKEAPFELFKDGLHTLQGTLILTPGGLKGNGLFDWDKGDMRSKLFAFKAHALTSDTTNLNIRAIDADDIVLNTKNVFADVDFDKQIGLFKANTEDVRTTLPYNKYETNLNEFVWDMKEEHVAFKTDENEKGNFLSIHPNQDSLTFDGETAFYNIKNSEFKIGGVDFIQTADALIYPDSGKVDIQPNGVMTAFNNARIVADVTNKYHVINKAKVSIKGKKHYTASGYYEYNIGKREQEILFGDIVGQRVGKGKQSEKKTITKATGTIEPEDSFYIDLKTEYRGKIFLSADSRKLKFDGFARLDAPKLPYRDWFSINSDGDKKDLVISYDAPKNYEGQPVRTGFFLSKETAEIYPRAMMPLYFRKDRPILDVKGVFKYDERKDQFIFGDSMKVVDSHRTGNLLSFNNNTAQVIAEGKLTLGSGLKNISITAAGRLKTVFEARVDTLAPSPDSQVFADMMAGIEIPLPDKLLRIMTADIKTSSFDAPEINFSKDTYYANALAEFVPDPKERSRTLTKLLNEGYVDLPKKVDNFTFLFSSLPMKWDRDYQSFVSQKDIIGLGSVKGETINKLMNCYIEFKMPSNEDDRVYIYIKSPSDYYYFFAYKQGILSTVSNNEKYNEALLGMKKKETVIKTADGEVMEIQPVNPGSADSFVRRVKAARG